MAKYLSTTEAAAQLGVHERHVRHLLDTGGLRGEKIGGRWLVLSASCEKFEKHPTKGRPKSNSDSDLAKSEK